MQERDMDDQTIVLLRKNQKHEHQRNNNIEILLHLVSLVVHCSNMHGK
jgi:hypothetical protein